MDKRNKLPLLFALTLACTSAFAQQTAFTFDAQVWPNAVIGGYVFDLNTRIDAIALADSGAVAFTAHRENGGTGRDQTAVFTKERLVAREGQVTDGKEILRIAPAVLGVTNLGQVAYEVLYRQPGHKDVHGGIFVEDRFATEFEPSPTGAPTQFTVAVDGMIRLRDGIMAPKSGNPILTGQMRASIERFKNVFLQRAIRNNPYGDIIGASADGVDVGIWERANRTPAQKRSQVAPASDAKSSCPPPAFPYPVTWTLGATNSGPVAARIFEEGNPSKSYDSPIYGRITAPYRQIQFDKSCAPMAIAIGDKSGHLEVRAPSGVLTFAKPDGTLQLPGYFQNAVAGSFMTSDVSFAINARGQIAIRIVVDGGGAVLLATPVIAKP